MISVPFHIPGCTVSSVEEEATHIRIDVKAQASQAACPRCHHSSTSIHSCYQRSPQDLPSSGKNVRLVLHVRRFRCRNRLCKQQTFAEPLPGLLLKHAQRTDRLSATLVHVALEVSSEPGSRLLSYVGIRVSPDTLLRVAKNAPEAPLRVPKVLGVDDFAFRRGRSYGTLLVDLETHRPVDVLPDRSADTLARWLQAHPGVSYLSRDRSTEYTRGANQGAPTVQQVADRWHVLKNLREALERFLGRVHTRLQQRYAGVGGPTHARGKQRRTKTEIAAAQMARARREARYEEVVTLYERGTSIVRIAEDLHLSRTTVRKFVAAGAFPERSSTLRSKSILDPYLPFLKRRVTQGPINASRLWRELQNQGFLGGYKVVARWLQEQGWQLRKGRYSQARKREDDSRQPSTREASVTQQPDETESSAQATSLPPLESPRHLVWLFLLDPTRLKEGEQQILSFIRQEQGVEQAYTLAQQFVRLVREHEVEALEPWLSACLESQLPELECFATSLQKEIAAIRAAITLPYSTGPVEGHVNRLKLIKRSMYGRGSFPLLRHRVLYPASIALPLHESCG